MPTVGERRAALILLLILCSLMVTLPNIGVVKAENNSLVTVNDEHFIIQEVLGMFRNFFVGSFNATTGYWIEINLSSSSTSNDPFFVYLNILSANHGTTFSAKGKEFSQTVYLDYEDVYNITIAKRPFYSSVRINGIIDVFHQETAGQNWVEVTRFTGGSNITTTDHFTCDHVDWRIRWEYEPRNDNIRTVFRVYIFPYSDAFPREPWFESIQKYGTEETSGILYIHDHNGSFDMDVLVSLESYTMIIEQDLESIPEFPSWTPLLIMLIVVIVVTVVYRINLKKHNRRSF